MAQGAADGVGWVNDKVVGDTVGFFTDQPRRAYKVTFVVQPTHDVLAPAAAQRHEALVERAQRESWSEAQLDQETAKLANQYSHQVLDALVSGRVPEAWDDSAETSDIPDYQDRVKQLTLE